MTTKKTDQDRPLAPFQRAALTRLGVDRQLLREFSSNEVKAIFDAGLAASRESKKKGGIAPPSFEPEDVEYDLDDQEDQQDDEAEPATEEPKKKIKKQTKRSEGKPSPQEARRLVANAIGEHGASVSINKHTGSMLIWGSRNGGGVV